MIRGTHPTGLGSHGKYTCECWTYFLAMFVPCVSICLLLVHSFVDVLTQKLNLQRINIQDLSAGSVIFRIILDFLEVMVISLALGMLGSLAFEKPCFENLCCPHISIHFLFSFSGTQGGWSWGLESEVKFAALFGCLLSQASQMFKVYSVFFKGTDARGFKGFFSDATMGRINI